MGETVQVYKVRCTAKRQSHGRPPVIPSHDLEVGGMVEGETVRIPGLGRFRLSDGSPIHPLPDSFRLIGPTGAKAKVLVLK